MFNFPYEVTFYIREKFFQSNPDPNHKTELILNKIIIDYNKIVDNI